MKFRTENAKNSLEKNVETRTGENIMLAWLKQVFDFNESKFTTCFT